MAESLAVYMEGAQAAHEPDLSRAADVLLYGHDLLQCRVRAAGVRIDGLDGFVDAVLPGRFWPLLRRVMVPFAARLLPSSAETVIV